jgi:hypothetical protein
VAYMKKMRDMQMDDAMEESMESPQVKRKEGPKDKEQMASRSLTPKYPFKNNVKRQVK